MSKTKQTKTSAQNKPTLTVFLLDRTGSMSSCKDEAISGFNAYIDRLKESKDCAGMRFTLTQFDSIAIDLLYDAVPLDKVKPLTSETYVPRANTPLYDAIGKTVRATEKQAGTKYKVLFITLTDGQENASSDWTEQSVRNLILEKEKDAWTFVHIGMGLSGWTAANTYSAGTQSFSNVLKTDHKEAKRVFARAAGQNISYAASVASAGAVMKGFWAGSDDDKKKKPTK